MILLAADENFNNNVLRALRHRQPQVDIVRVQDAGLRGADDPSILEWAAARGRILLTHDVTTMAHFAFERVRAGLPMAGVLVVDPYLAIGAIVDDILLVVECSLEGEWDARVGFVPF